MEQGLEDKRSFFGPDEVTIYYINPPTAEDIKGADWQYSKIYTECLVEGITTSAEMMDILNRRGIIGPDFELRASELQRNLGEAINELDYAKNADEKREIAVRVAQAREELFQWNQRLNGPMNNTAEQISDDSRLEYLTSRMIVDENGERVWDSFDSYLKEKSQALALRARFEVMLFLQGLDSDFLDQTPEALAMKEVEKESVERAESILRASNEAIEDSEKSINSINDELDAELDDSTTTEKKSTTTKKSSGTKKSSKAKKDTVKSSKAKKSKDDADVED